VRVSVDHAARTLVVEYRGRAEPITRAIDLPPDAETTERAAVLLAGNLARDEADELVDALRKPKPATTEWDTNEPPDAEQDREERRDLDLLGAALAHDMQRSRARKSGADVTLALGFGTMGLSLGASTYGIATGAHWSVDAGMYTLQVADVFLITSALVRPGNFEELNATYARGRADGLPPGMVRANVEQAWLRSAQVEHYNRRLIGWLMVGLGSLMTAGSALALAVDVAQPSSAQPIGLGPWVGWTALSLADLTLGIHGVTSDGPLESALHDYEGSAGRRVRLSDSLSLVPVVAPARGGGFVGLGGRF
jgi:hypothetical protein